MRYPDAGGLTAEKQDRRGSRQSLNGEYGPRRQAVARVASWRTGGQVPNSFAARPIALVPD